MNQRINQIGEQVFRSACELLKREGHITNQLVATAIGVDGALMSKWMSGKSVVSRHYNQRIIDYLTKPELRMYAEALRVNIISCLLINKYGRIYERIVNDSFESVMDYVFNELDFVDIQKENSLIHRCYEHLKLALVRKTMHNDIDGRFYSLRESIFEHMVLSHKRSCITHGINDRNTMIMEHYTSRGVEERILILLRSRHYDHGHRTTEMILDFLLTHRPFGQIDRYIILVNPYEMGHYMYSNCPDHNMFYYIVDENIQPDIAKYSYFEINAVLDPKVYTPENLAHYSNRIANRILHIIALNGLPEGQPYPFN